MFGGINFYTDLIGPKLDFDQQHSPHFRFALLSVPRCGSNLLGSMLIATQQAGCPLEYLNREFLNAYLKTKGLKQIDLGYYLNDLESRRTSANGRFGVKVHWHQFADIYNGGKGGIKREGVAYLRGMDRVIRLYRRDKVAQAVSLYVASVTNRWVEVADGKVDESPYKELPFDPIAISNYLQQIITEERNWLSFLQLNKIKYDSMSYEELAEEYQEASIKILSWLGVSDIKEPPQPMIKKQENPHKQRLRDEYLAYVGA